MYRISIDRSLCSGYGVCESLAPHLFALDGEGVAVLRADLSEDEVVREACDSCPMGAISFARVEAA